MFFKDILPFLSQYNYGITDQSTLDVIGNLRSFVDNAEQANAGVQGGPSTYQETPSQMSPQTVPSFASTFEFHEPMLTSTQICQEEDPLKVELVEVTTVEQTDMKTHDTVEAWMEANCGSAAVFPVLFTSETPAATEAPVEEREKSESNPITFGATNKIPLEAKSGSINQKPWKKFEFTDTDDTSPPLQLPSNPIEVKEDLVQKPNPRAKQRKKHVYTPEIQKILDNAIAKRKAAKKANRLLKRPEVLMNEKVVPKEKITWRNFAHLFPESSDDEITPSTKKQQPIESKEAKSSEVAMEIEAEKPAMVEDQPIESKKVEQKEVEMEIVTVKPASLEAPKKLTWKDLYIADSD